MEKILTAKQILGNDEVINAIYEQDEGGPCNSVYEKVDEMIMVDLSDFEDVQEAVEEVGLMCLSSHHERLYYLDDQHTRFYLTADSNHHAMQLMGLV